MAESTLSIGAPELRQEIAFYMGYGRTSGSWSVSQLAEINAIMQSGVRRVYYPPAVVSGFEGYEWSFLRPTTTLAIVADDGNYDLPDDFGRLVGPFHYPVDEYRAPIVIVSVAKLLGMRAWSDVNDAPKYASIRYKSSTGVSGQRQEALFYPEPNASWTLSYEYEAYSGQLTDSYPYPLGGMQMAELYMESCLAVAESRIHDEIGPHAQQYQQLLVAMIARDRKRGPQIYGQMGHHEPEVVDFKRGYTGSTYPITYKTVEY